MSKKDSTGRTILVATILCVVCSIMVSGSAVSLKDKQLLNKKLDVEKNLLLCAGILDKDNTSVEKIHEGMKRVQTLVINFENGMKVETNPDTFDQEAASKKAGTSYSIPSELDLPKIKVRSTEGKVYLVNDESGNLDQIILPIKGAGLWSTLYGFLALSADTKFIKGIAFHEHGETPGLGGEIENPNWQAIWKGKEPFNDSFEPVIQVIKGAVEEGTSEAQHKIDGISGATITARGVEFLVKYWLGANAYGPYLKNLREGNGGI
jgi:Na+-transporting NADH:ubiquinone oxidoreductase subunit C